MPVATDERSPARPSSGALPAQASPGAAVAPAPPVGEEVGSLKEAVRAETERVERELIQRALDETGGNVTQAARKLQISRKSLQTKMKELGLGIASSERSEIPKKPRACGIVEAASVRDPHTHRWPSGRGSGRPTELAQAAEVTVW